jgi:WD40 repeat protein
MSKDLYLATSAKSSNIQVSKIYKLDNTIVCCRTKSTSNAELVAFGTTKGTLWLFSFQNVQLKLIRKFLAHQCTDGDQDMNFGSLVLFSEIWTLCFHPQDPNILCTGSEDQTVKVWDLAAQSCIVTLRGHTRAVTGVVWRVSGNDNCIITCSDDMTVRLYKGSDFSLVHVFHTSFIKEWHTITYLACNERGNKIGCVTQNGYLFVFNLERLECEFHERLHTGSVEGLDWKGNFIASCSSDCTVSISYYN